MKLRLLLVCFILILGAFLIASCGTAPPVNSVPTPTLDPTGVEPEPALDPAPTADAQPTAEPLPQEYPPPEPALPSDYPGPSAIEPTVDPYPGGVVWIIRPVGIQCEDGTTFGYGDLREAVATLTAAGLRVTGSEMTELMVAASCGSPTSAHFRIQINADDLDYALSMGWEREFN